MSEAVKFPVFVVMRNGHIMPPGIHLHRANADATAAREEGEVVLLFAHPGIVPGWVPVNIDLVKFLLGEGEYMGQSFGENTGRAKYWWRKYLRGSIPAAPKGRPAGFTEEDEG